MRPVDPTTTSGAPVAARAARSPSRAWLIVFVLLLLGAWTATTYNRMTQAQQAVDAQWAQVESVYQRRADLIPNLVAATQGYLAHERALFESLARARELYAASSGSPQRVEAANQLQELTARLIAVVEQYPELRSREVVLSLMDELAGTENRIAVERRRYNERVRDYNQLVLGVPRSLVAGPFGFKPRPYFQAEADAAPAPVTH